MHDTKLEETEQLLKENGFTQSPTYSKVWNKEELQVNTGKPEQVQKVLTGINPA